MVDHHVFSLFNRLLWKYAYRKTNAIYYSGQCRVMKVLNAAAIKSICFFFCITECFIYTVYTSHVICIKKKKTNKTHWDPLRILSFYALAKHNIKTNIFQRFILSQFYVGIRKYRLLLIRNTLQVVINGRYIPNFTQLKTFNMYAHRYVL